MPSKAKRRLSKETKDIIAFIHGAKDDELFGDCLLQDTFCYGDLLMALVELARRVSPEAKED